MIEPEPQALSQLRQAISRDRRASIRHLHLTGIPAATVRQLLRYYDQHGALIQDKDALRRIRNAGFASGMAGCVDLFAGERPFTGDRDRRARKTRRCWPQLSGSLKPLSYSLTTLRDRHVSFEGNRMRFRCRGKSGQMHDVALQDRRLARIVRDCRDLPGYELFQYIDDFGEVHSIDSSDVDAYLRDVSCTDFSASHLRTWAGTIQAALALAEIGPSTSDASARHNIVEAVRLVARRLGNNRGCARRGVRITPGRRDNNGFTPQDALDGEG